MKIVKLAIHDFRHIKKLELDFTDSLGRVRDMTVIVGPNTSGKTTILNAIAASVLPLTETSRFPFSLTPRVVRSGATYARIETVIRFSPDEIDATRQLFSLLNLQDPIPDCEEVHVTWTYPDPDGQHPYGLNQSHPKLSRNLFKGRISASRLLRTGHDVNLNWFERVGAMFLIDQERHSMTKAISRDIWTAISGPALDSSKPPPEETADTRTILLALAVESLVPPEKGTEPSQFARVKERYDRLCAPHQLVGPVRGELGNLDIRFRNGKHEYGFEGLSSGEAMVLMYFVKLVTERINRSVMLIDELELHQHPIWQRRLLDVLPRIGMDNQFIITTHSPYLRDVVSREAIINLGELGERHTREELTP